MEKGNFGIGSEKNQLSKELQQEILQWIEKNKKLTERLMFSCGYWIPAALGIQSEKRLMASAAYERPQMGAWR